MANIFIEGKNPVARLNKKCGFTGERADYWHIGRFVSEKEFDTVCGKDIHHSIVQTNPVPLDELLVSTISDVLSSEICPKCIRICGATVSDNPPVQVPESDEDFQIDDELIQSSMSIFNKLAKAAQDSKKESQVRNG